MCSELTILAYSVLHEQEICRNTRRLTSLFICSELMILAHSVLREQEICRSIRWQPVFLDGSRAGDMSLYRTARRRAVLIRSVAAVSLNEFRAVGISSLRMTRTGDPPLRLMAALSTDVSRGVGIS